VLDQSPIPSGSKAAEALADSVELATLTEALGYHRYWVAEHHGSKSFAGCSPEILVGHIASATSRIRVGSGGVMLMHYSPLKVAENFKLLATLHPGRIDLGIGRAPGSDGLTAAALAYGSQIGIEYLPAKIADLKAFVYDKPAYTEALREVNPAPQVEVPPEIWMLGSTDEGAKIAAHFGLPFSFAHFISPQLLERASHVYREKFISTPEVPEPEVTVGVFVLCADTREEAEDLALCRDLWRLKVGRGQFEPFPSVAEARDFNYSAADEAKIAERREHQILGTSEDVARKLHDLAGTAGANELMVISITHEFERRARCYELLADAIH
jgi:luciferase family oxidoreductase group 1